MRISDWSSDVCSSDLQGMIEVLLRGLGGDENYVVDPFQDRLLAGQKATHMNVMLIDAGDFGRWHEGHLGNDPARDDLVQTQFGDRHGHRGVYRKKKDILALDRKRTRRNSSH